MDCLGRYFDSLLTNITCYIPNKVFEILKNKTLSEKPTLISELLKKKNSTITVNSTIFNCLPTYQEQLKISTTKIVKVLPLKQSRSKRSNLNFDHFPIIPYRCDISNGDFLFERVMSCLQNHEKYINVLARESKLQMIQIQSCSQKTC